MNFEKIDLKWQNMLAGIQAQAAFVQHSPHLIYGDIRAKLDLSTPPTKVYLCGCGDSWYSGMATRYAIEAWSRIPGEAVESLEFSKYLVHTAPAGSLVLVVSNSGRVARSIEAVVQANRRSLLTVAATSNLTEGIAVEANHTIVLAYSERRFAPGTSSYMACLVVEYCLALYLAEVNGILSNDEVQEKLTQITALAKPVQETIQNNLPHIEELISKVNLTEDRLVFIGAGPNYGTAFFSMAKIIEATRAPAAGQELEEWAHEQFFTTNERTITIVLAPPGASLERARELIPAIRAMGSRCMVICQQHDRQTISLADYHLPVMGACEELLSPILYCIPAELLAFHLAVANRTVMLGFDNPKIKEINFQQIFGSHIQRE